MNPFGCGRFPSLGHVFYSNDAFYSVEEEETEKIECLFELSFKVTKTMRFDGGRRKRRKFCILVCHR